MKRLNYLLIIFLLLGSSSCDWFTTKGCTDSTALNRDFSADKDDGSCRYSRVTFYAQYPAYSGIPINRIEVSVNGNSIGAINAIYPNGPGNCSAQGTVSYLFTNGASADWNTVVFLANGGTVLGSGSISPSSVSECIRVNVTR